MVRREYVSFLRERRQDIGFGDRGPDPSRWLWLVLAVGFVAISVWWFGFRDADDIASERILDDTTIPTLLLPSAIDEQGGAVLTASLECSTLVEEWTTFQGGVERTGCLTTRTITSPEIMWHVETGIQGWRNNPVIEDGAVFVGSAGVAQFSRDRRDGIYSFDLASGVRRWIYTTELDVNGVAVSDGVVVATGDEGRIWALSARDGSLLWTDDLGVGVFGDPLILGDMVVIGDGAGQVRAYNLETGGDPLWTATVNGPVRGGASSDGERIYVAGEGREVLALAMNGEELWRVEVTARGPQGDRARIFAAPTVTETMLLISLLREDVYAEPALMALDKETGEVIWRARDAAGIKTQWANVRSSPAVVGDFVVYGEGYSEQLVVLDLATGETAWSLPVGEFCYPHWPSPAVNNGIAYLARHDGALYAVNLKTQEIEWSIYLGDAEGTGAFPADYGIGFCDWGPESGHSILASPAVSPEGVIVVGSLEGRLMAIGDSEWDS